MRKIIITSITSFLFLLITVLFLPKNIFAQTPTPWFTVPDNTLDCNETNGPNIDIGTSGIGLNEQYYNLEICDQSQGNCPNGPGSVVFQHDVGDSLGLTEYGFALDDVYGQYCGSTIAPPNLHLNPDACFPPPQFWVYLQYDVVDNVPPDPVYHDSFVIYVDFFSDGSNCEALQDGNPIGEPLELCQCDSICTDISPSTYECVAPSQPDPTAGPLDWDELYDELDWEFGRSPSIGEIITRVLTYLLPVAGLLLLLYLIYGGFMFMTSGGDPQKASTARGIITTALIGFVIIFIAFWIVQIVARIFGLGDILTIF
jgi:hypothetical protein